MCLAILLIWRLKGLRSYKYSTLCFYIQISHIRSLKAMSWTPRNFGFLAHFERVSIFFASLRPKLLRIICLFCVSVAFDPKSWTFYGSVRVQYCKLWCFLSTTCFSAFDHFVGFALKGTLMQI